LIRDLLAQSRGESEVLTRVRSALPLPVRPHCSDALVSGTTLIVMLDSSAWLTRARFSSEQITKALSAFAIDEVRYRIRPSGVGGPKPEESPAQRRLPEAVVAHLYEAAQCQSDAGLRRALIRLADHHASAAASDDL
jgi:hypothetical protein